MKKLSQEELNEILKEHKIWLANNDEGKKADLSYTDLSKLDLRYTDLERVCLTGANLSNASLFCTKLFYADLSNANLSCAKLSYADLSNANLTGADLRYANLSFANLYKTNLTEADLTNAILTIIKLDNCNLTGAILDKKYLQVSCIGSRNGITTYCVEDNHVWCGCWNLSRGGSLEEFRDKIEYIYGRYGKSSDKHLYKEYKNAIEYFKKFKRG